MMGSVSILRWHGRGAGKSDRRIFFKCGAGLAAAIMLAGCQTEDAGVRAARMEAQDDAACKTRQDYQLCRNNLMVYRRQAMLEDEQQRARVKQFGQALQETGRAMQGTQNVNVTVSCTYGPGTC